MALKKMNKYYYTIFKHLIKYYTKLNIYVQVHLYSKNMWQLYMSNIFKQKDNMITKLFLVIVIIMILNKSNSSRLLRSNLSKFASNKLFDHIPTV